MAIPNVVCTYEAFPLPILPHPHVPPPTFTMKQEWFLWLCFSCHLLRYRTVKVPTHRGSLHPEVCSNTMRGSLPGAKSPHLRHTSVQGDNLGLVGPWKGEMASLLHLQSQPYFLWRTWKWTHRETAPPDSAPLGSGPQWAPWKQRHDVNERGLWELEDFRHER